jgi:ABC-2 type transport system ATP-binding protein
MAQLKKESEDPTSGLSTQEPPPVVVSQLVKKFGRQLAIDRLDLTIQTGETFGLIGPNGSGKTTLIRLLVGLVRPTSGTMRVLGKSVPDQHAAARIGYMTQLSALYLDLTASENLHFFANIYGLRGKQQNQRIAEMLERVDLADRANDIVGNFSGGMRQRLSLACALVHQPRLALLDEPTVGVDPELRRTFWDYFHQLNQEGVTLIVSTHHLDEAARCTRLGLIRLGKMLAEGSPVELLQRSGKENMEEAFLYYAARQEVQV